MANGNTDTLTLTIDGVEVTVPAGTRVIDAAERVGVVVPRYCYHPGIPTRPAQCRMCLVEVEGRPKLEPSCTLQAQDEMVVHTASDRAEKARQASYSALYELCEQMSGRTICVLADSVVFPLKSSLDKFRGDYEARMKPSLVAVG